MTLDPISGAIVSEELSRLEHELFDADWAEAKQRLAETPRSPSWSGPRDKRRADALVEMAARSKAMLQTPDARTAVLGTGRLPRRCRVGSVS